MQLISKGKMRNTQLIIMGIVSLIISPMTLLVTMGVYNLEFLQSISASGTIANQVAPLLPYFLGMLSIFALSYSITTSYSKSDAISTFLMFIGFTIVAWQPCETLYITQQYVGVFGVTVAQSDILHGIGALIGFGSLIYWIMFCFTKSDKPKYLRTKEKNFRNKLYYGFGITMTICILLFILFITGGLGVNFPIVFILECIILTFSGIACLIKGGLAFKDKPYKPTFEGFKVGKYINE